MKRVVVTGSGGFIGRNSIAPLRRLGYEVHAVDLHPPKDPIDAHFHPLDLFDPQQTDRLIAQISPTHLIHFAWYAEHGKYWTSPLNHQWVTASESLFKSFAAAGGRRAVFAGTCGEYDWSHSVLIEDKTPSNPATLYGQCKNSLRQTVQTFAAESSISVAWARIFFLYGPGEHPARLIPSILNPLLADLPALVRSGGHERNLMHVRDVAGAFAAILDSPLQGIVNVSSNERIVLGDVARLAGDLLGKSHLLTIENAPGDPSNPRVLLADTTKLRSIGFAPTVSLRQGLGELIAEINPEARS